VGIRYRYRQKCKRKKAYHKRRNKRLREAVQALKKK
jgi:hypothetical protein